MKSFKKRRFIKQYLFFYMLSLMAPLLMGVLIYAITYNLEYKRVEQENIWQLNQAMEKLNQGLIEAERLSLQLLTNSEMEALGHQKDLFSSENIYKAADFLRQNSLIPQSLLNDLFEAYFIIEIPEWYVFSRNLVSPLSAFYTYDYRVSDFFNDREFSSYLKEMKIGGFYPETPLLDVKDSQKHYYPYFHIYKESPDSTRVVMVLIDPDHMRSLFNSPGSGQDLALSLYYNDVPIVTGAAPLDTETRELINDSTAGMVRFKDQYLSYSRYKNWSCQLIQPANRITNNIRYIPRLILYMILGTLLFCCLFLLVLAQRASKPILFLIEKLKQDRDVTGLGSDDLSTLDFFVEQLKGRNHQLEELLEEQRTKLKTNFLTSLLHDTVPNPAQIPMMARHAGVQITISAPYFTVVIQLKDSDTALGEEWEHLFPISLISLQKKIYEMFGPQAYLIQINLNELCLLVNVEENQKEQRRKELTAMLSTWVTKELQESYVIGVSLFHYGWPDVSRSFREARSALIYNWPSNENTINIYQTKADAIKDSDLYFPREIDHVILDAVRMGQSKELKECLSRIHRENLEFRKLESFAQNILISHHKQIMVSIKSNLEITDKELVRQLDILLQEPTEQLSLFLTKVNKLLLSLCEYFYSDQTKKELHQAEYIREFLEANFHNNQLSLSLTAEELGMTGQYITRLVKKYFGKTFRNYMEDLRMDYVRKLILETNDPIHHLVEKGGYNSMNTFCKAFKRKFGYNASSLRD